MKELRECIKSRLDAELVSYCDLLGICISHKGKKSDSFKPDSEYMFHTFHVEDGKADIYWGHYDLTISEALSIWKDKISNKPAGNYR
jgi:hypothetical protein